MGFTCTGNTIFKTVSLNTGTAGQLTATIYADDAWNQDTTATITAYVSGTPALEESFELCDYLLSGTCGSSGTVELDLSFLLPETDTTITSSMMKMAIASADIEITAQPDGSTDETCAKSTVASTYKSAFTSGGGASKKAGFLFGTAAIVGLAAYAVKRRNQRRNRSKSNYGADEQLYGGELA
mmetsp:Transcript_24567/g.37216  ORF Transcript_24567/g.37216 Transcript_24567/m.37216 type:complete len:183 (-) Transcript_24567:87-635(-)